MTFRTITCRQAEEEIQKSLDQDLTLPERERLDAHLDCCEACRHAWAELHLLTRAGRRWASPTLADDPGEAFNAQVLARLVTRPVPISPPIWLPLLATCLLLGLFAWLPGFGETSGQTIASAVHQTPSWLGVELHSLSWDAFAPWVSSLSSLPLPGWTWSVLLAIGMVNGAFCVQARRRNLQ